MTDTSSGSRLARKTAPETEAYAIVGMACRFPGADDYREFWELLAARVNWIGVVPEDRWDVERYYSPDPEAPNTTVSKWGGFLRDVERFDADFFGISPREARLIDPQQRMMLHLAWECIEDAGYAPPALAGRSIGVFVAGGGHDGLILRMRDEQMVGHIATGNYMTFAAARISYCLDLRGPAIAIDTACSGSLVALHQAIESIRSGTCEEALVGAVGFNLAPYNGLCLGKLGMLSPTGQCHAFGAAADGYVRSEGAALVLIKPLRSALADDDPIRGVVLGSAVNHTGRVRTMTSPSVFAQSKVITAALRTAGVGADTVSYIEAHGTGTPLGDPIEINALKRAFRDSPSRAAPWCAIGAVKTNIGHLEPSAGMAGLVKAVLCLEHAHLPGLANFKEPNPRLGLEDSPFYLLTESRDWIAPVAADGSPVPRRAGVSSFGFSGVNAHVVLEEAPPRAAATVAPPRSSHMFTLSARTDAALRALAARHADYLTSVQVEDACLTVNTARAQMEHRIAVVGTSAEVLATSLRAFVKGPESAAVLHGVAGATPPKVAFLFTGQGAQYPRMGRELYETQPVFREVVDRCDSLLGGELREVILSADRAGDLNATQYTQPALFTIEYALARLWISFGVIPAAVLGHSVGEYVAACVAGVFSLEDGLRLIAARGRLMQQLPAGGAMAVALTSQEHVAEVIRPFAGEVSIAALNGPANVVFSGRAAAVARITDSLTKAGVTVTPLTVSHAFHSPLVDPMLDDFSRIAAGATYCKPDIDIVSNVTGALAGSEMTTATYWRRHVREPVRFADGMAALRALGCNAYIEAGPHPVLIGMARAGSDEGTTWCPSLRRGRPDWQTLFESLGQLFVRGAPIQWQAVHAGGRGRRIPMPTYAFQGDRYRAQPLAEGPASVLVPEKSGALLTRLLATGRFNEEQAKLLPGLLDVLSGIEAGNGAPTDGLLYRVAWREQRLQAAGGAPSGKWLVFTDRGGVGALLAVELSRRGVCVTCVDAEEQDFVTLLSGDAVTGVAYLRGLDARADADWVRAQSHSVGGALRLAQALAQTASRRPPRLYLVTQQTTTFESVAQATLWGLGAGIAAEMPGWHCGRIDLEVADAAGVSALADELLALSVEDRVVLRGGRRLVARLTRAVVTQPAGRKDFQLRPDAAYLVTGGLGGLGLRFARWLVEHGARNIVLVSRRAPGEAADAAVRELRELGAAVLVRSADVADAVAVAALVTSLPTLRGVVHAAGTVDDALLGQQSWDSFARVFAAKVAGAWNLHQATRPLPLDFFLLCSSSAALLGNPGQANYAAANSFLDALAEARRREGLPATAIDWGVWSGAGMGSRPEVLQHLARRGVTPLSDSEGLSAAELALTGNEGHLAAIRLDWSKGLEALGRRIPLLEDFAVAAAAPTASPDFRHELESVPLESRAELLFDHVRLLLANVMGVDDPRALAPERGFFALGLDSLTSVELRSRLQRSLHIELPATVAFDYPTLEALVRYLQADALRPLFAKAEAVSLVQPALAETADEAAIARELAALQAALDRVD